MNPGTGATGSGAQTAAAQPRALGLSMCTALVVGNVIGIGIFFMPASLAEFGLNAITGWIITLLGCAFLAICFAGMARSFPQDDGPYSYTRRAFGEGIAFAVMWCYWVSVWVSNAAIAIGVVGYLIVFIPAVGRVAWLPPLTALALVWTFVLINLRGARAAGWVQIMTTLLKLLPLAAVIILGVWVLLAHPSAYVAHIPPTPLTFNAVSSVSAIAMFAMLGIECAMIPACRVCNPERTIPRATVLGTILTALIYLCVSVVPVLLIPQKTLMGSTAPFAELFSQWLGAGSGRLLAAFVIISGLGALNGWTLMVGEVTQCLARHGRFPSALARENAHGAPTRALLVSGVIASIMLLTNYNESISGVFVFLTVVCTAATLPVYMTCTIGILVLRQRGLLNSLAGPPLFWTLAVACTVAYGAWVFIGIGAKPLLWMLALGAVGVVIYLGSKYGERRVVAAR